MRDAGSPNFSSVALAMRALFHVWQAQLVTCRIQEAVGPSDHWRTCTLTQPARAGSQTSTDASVPPHRGDWARPRRMEHTARVSDRADPAQVPVGHPRACPCSTSSAPLRCSTPRRAPPVRQAPCATSPRHRPQDDAAAPPAYGAQHLPRAGPASRRESCGSPSLPDGQQRRRWQRRTKPMKLTGPRRTTKGHSRGVAREACPCIQALLHGHADHASWFPGTMLMPAAAGEISATSWRRRDTPRAAKS